MAKLIFPYPDSESLGVEYLMSACLAKGHEAELLFYRSFNILFNKQFDTDYEQLARQIVESGADIAAFSCLTNNFNSQLRLAECIKKQRPEILCLFGGVHVTAVPRRVIAHDAVDGIALGEAEHSLCRFLEQVEHCGSGLKLPQKEIPGFVFKRGADLVGEFELPPFPGPETWTRPCKAPFIERIPEAGNTYIILTSRGCPYSCSFCHNSSSFLKGKKKNFLRKQTVEKVIEELLWAKETFDCHDIWFIDDCFTTDVQWLERFCVAYKKQIGLPFACFSHPLAITPEVADILKAAGCYCVQLGVQSLSTEVCELIHRKGAEKDVAKAITALKNSGILAAVDHILGLPGDTVDIQEYSVLFYNKYRPFWVTVLWLTYFPGTRIVDTALEMGMIDARDKESIESGFSCDQGYLITAVHFKKIKHFYAIAFILNWMPFLPRPLVHFLITTKLYRLLKIHNYFITVVLPRGIRSFHKKFQRRQAHLKAFLNLFKKAVPGK